MIKRLFTIICLLGLLASCKEGPVMNGFDPQTPDISFSDAIQSVDYMGGKVELQLNSNLPWRISCDAPWITLGVSHGSQSEKISIKVARNRTKEERSGSISAWITDKDLTTISIVQDAAPASEKNTYYVKVNGNPSADGFSWESASTLPSVLELVGDGDVVCLASGTYAPTALLSTGEKAEEMTFEIFSNITLEGGYPADASTGAESNYSQNPTVLSGALSGTSAYHVVTVTAPKSSSDKVVLKGLTISNGAGLSSVQQIIRNVNGAIIDAGKGGGLFIGCSNVDVISCTISDNSACHAAGVSIFNTAEVNFENCRIVGNTAVNNGGGIWNEGATVYMNNCSIESNISGQQAAGYYSIDGNYVYTSVSRIYNTTFTGNDNTTVATNRSGGAAYIRACSDALFVNCTFSANNAGYGGAIAAHGANSSRTAHCTLLSCTVVDNKANTAGGGFLCYNNYGYITAYNTIISGNIGGDAEVQNPDVNRSNIATYSSILGASLLDANAESVAGWAFDATTMLGEFGYFDASSIAKTYPIIKSNSNPAQNMGMSNEDLISVSAGFTPSVNTSLITKDQNGHQRDSKSIGACTSI